MLKLAKKIAKSSDHKFAFHACIIARGGNVIAIGHNHGQVHAEHMALSSLWPSERKSTKLWSIRVSKTGRFAMAKPCDDCMKEINDAGVKTVMYTDSDGKIQRMKP